MSSIEIILLIFSVISTLLLIVLAFLFFRKGPGSDPTGLASQLNDLRREVQDTTNKQRQEIQQRLDVMHDQFNKNWNESTKAFQFTLRDVTERLTKLDETNKQVLNFSGQLQSLENILKNPKHRGILGEYWLETLLGQVLQPTQYRMQYDLGLDENTNSKLIADAVIFVRDMIIPIDAKFSLENYNRISQEADAIKREVLNRDFKTDVKKRIDETSKYIHPERGTTNFAFMFVPAEGVYYNLLTSNVGAAEVNSKDLVEYAFSKGVMIVSPTSFFAYLQTVIMGLKALQIEESVKDIQKQAEHLMRHLKAYEDYHNKIGRNLEASVNAYSDASGELKKIDKDIFKITDGAVEKQLEPAEIRKIG
jgi:DNA recombination protein RmuC